MPAREPSAIPQRCQLWVLVGSVLLLPLPAEAHTAVQDAGSFWSGVAHLLTSVDQLGFLIGLASWTRLHDGRVDAQLVSASSLATAAGVLIGAWLIHSTAIDIAAGITAAMAALMIVVGLAGAAGRRLGVAPLLATGVAGAAVGGIAAAEATGGLSLPLFALGTAIAAAAVLSYALLAMRRIVVDWGGIALRAGASWIAAIGLMLLALSVARHRGGL